MLWDRIKATINSPTPSRRSINILARANDSLPPHHLLPAVTDTRVSGRRQPKPVPVFDFVNAVSFRRPF
ncbi:hypothetical protein TNIN_166171, partial [Trichonephila inaurata madagascariensis]